jgi:hypothetical protein
MTTAIKVLSPTQSSDFFKPSVTIGFAGAERCKELLITLILDKYQQNLPFPFQITIYHHVSFDDAYHSAV